MSRLWKKIICMSLVLTMIVPSNVALAAEMPEQAPVAIEEEQDVTVEDVRTTEEAVSEEETEEVVSEEETEEVVSEEETEEAVSKEETEEAVSEEETEEVVSEEETEEAVSEEETEKVVLEEEETEGTTEVVEEEIVTEEAAEVVVTTGWVGDDDERQYIKSDGTYATEEILLIDGQLYAFDEDSYRYNEGESWFGGRNLEGDWVYGYVRANANGTLKRNVWHYVEYEETWYYYGNDGMGAQGLVIVHGVQYYFEYDGSMVTNAVLEIDGSYYFINASGHLTVAEDRDGWHQIDGQWYYRQNGEFLQYCTAIINGVLYGFDDYGVWCVNREFYAQFYDGSDYGYFRAKADGSLYVNSWYYDSEDEEWYYYGSYGIAPEDEIRTIAGTKYYFYYSGRLATNTTVEVDGVKYVADSNGVLKEVSSDGWYAIDGNWYYVYNGEFLEDCIHQIAGKYYAFDWAGRMYANDDFWLEDGYYRAHADGSLYVNQWYQDQWGEWYYYGAAGKAPSYCLMTIAGVQYYFGYAGYLYNHDIRIIDGKIYLCDGAGVAKVLPNGWSQVQLYPTDVPEWYYTQNGYVVNGLVNTGSGYYVFDDSCMLTSYDAVLRYRDIEGVYKYYLTVANTGKVITTTGWYLYEGNYYFINSDYSLRTGLSTIGGQTYFFEPEMAYGKNVTAAGVSYVADLNGALKKITSDGFYHTSNGSFYVSGGTVLKDSWKLINGNYYYFGFDGYAYYDTIEEIDGVAYAFREDGVMASNSFVYIWGDTYYASASGALVTGEQLINGKWYYFDEDGELESMFVDGANGISIYASNGEYLGTVSGNGWKYIGGQYYYVSNGELVYDEKVTINGADYIFNWDGWMYENEIAFWDGDYYYCTASGAVQKNAWCFVNGSYYYADAKGILYRNGEYTINGTKYYFDTNGKMAAKDFVLDGTLYKIAASGAIISKSAANNVSLANGNVVFYQQGKPYTGWKGNKYYRQGVLMAGGVKYCGDAYYAFDKNGNYLKNTWYDVHGDGWTWAYLKSNGKAADDETLTIGGYTYAFDGYYMVADCVHQGYYYDRNGHRVSAVSGAGWKQYGGEWYYVHNGSVVKGRLLDIGGVTYGFYYDGELARRGMAYISGKVYFFDNNGVRQKYVGWKQIDGRWYYFSQDYSSFEGWLQDGGKQYYMDRYEGMLTGTQLIEGALYNFGTNGVMQKGYKAPNGWVKVDYNWCYVINGKPVTGLKQIGGNWYYFYNHGVMACYDVTDYGYATSSGVLLRSVGWHKLSSGEWIYIGEGNEVYTNGAYYINGVLYTFDVSGYMM